MKAKSLKKLLVIKEICSWLPPGLDGWKVCSQEQKSLSLWAIIYGPSCRELMRRREVYWPKTSRSTVCETLPATLAATHRYCAVSLALARSSTNEPSDVTRWPRTCQSPLYHVTSGLGVPRTGHGRLTRLFSMIVMLDMTSAGRYGASVITSSSSSSSS